MAVITDMLNNLLQMEFFQLLFPFLLALAIIYGVLTKISKDLPQSARAIISMLLSLFVMLYSSINPQFYLFLTALSGPWLMIACAVLFVVVLFSLVGINLSEIGKKDTWNTSKTILGLLVAFIFIAFFFGYGVPIIPSGINISSDLWSMIFFVIILAIVMVFLTRGEEKKTP